MNPQQILNDAINFLAMTAMAWAGARGGHRENALAAWRFEQDSLHAISVLLRAKEQVAEASLRPSPQGDGDAGEQWELGE